MPGHPSVAVLPAALALGEWAACDGLSMVTAFVLGFEVEAKLGRLMQPELGETPWHSAGTLGTLGAAVAASYLLDLSVEQTVNALGMAASMASGLSSNHGSMTKPFHPGNAARNGIVAGQLAQRGFTAQGAAFEADMGFLQAFAGRDCQVKYRTDPGWLERELGNPFDVVEPGTDIKLYPSCNLTHPAIDACLELLHAYPEIHVQRITRVECKTGRKIPYLISERFPRTGLEGKFSLEYCLALALLKKRVEVDDFSDDTLTDSQFDALMKKIVVGTDSSLLSAGGWSYGATRVVVNLEGGGVFSRTVENPKGSIQKPLDEKELYEKYRKLASRALLPEQVRESLSLLQNIQRLPDVRQLTGQLGTLSLAGAR
jgi:2-methylcitrate dehydratase PrpD